MDVEGHIREQMVGGELGLEEMVERMREAGIIATPVIYKDLAHQRTLVQWTCHSRP